MSIDSSSKAALHKGYKHWCPEVEPREDWDKDFNFVLIRSIEELKKLDVEHKFVAWDTETSGLNPDIDWLVGFSFSFDGKTGYYVPVKHDDIALGKEALDIFFSILSKAGTQFLYNCRFDQRFFEAAGYSLEGLRYYDVMNAIWLADTNVLMPSLKASERRFLGWIPKTFSETLGEATTFQHVPAEDAYKYACLAEHELVMMGDMSTKRICEIEVGDMVCTPNGPRKVTAVYNNGIRECYRLVWNDGSTTIATGNHKFLFHDKDTGEEVWRSVDEISSLYQKGPRSSLNAVRITPEGKRSDFLLCEVSKFRTCNVYDIQVEEVHCFVMANGIISHNCTDALGTYHLALISNQFYKESYPASKYDNDALYPMMRLENTPQRLDLEYLKSLCSSVEIRIDESLQQVYQLAGCTFNVNSPAQFGKIMLERFGVDTGVRTPTGAMKADLKTLEAWMVKHGSKASPEVKDFLSAYKEYKKTVKFKSSYLDKYIKAAEDADTFPIRFSYKFQSVPCLTENNTVLTKSRGFVSIKDVQSDDMIWTAWGYKRVLWNHSHEVDEFYRVTLKNGMTLEGTGHHPVLVRKSPLEKVAYSGMTKDDVEWAGIQDLKPDEPVVINHTHASLSCQDSWKSSLARIMGYFYGHGRMTDGEMMSLIFDNPDLSYHYAGWLKSLFGDKKVFPYDLGKGKVEYSITRQTLANFLVEHDVIPAFDENCFWRLDPVSTYIEEAYRISRMPDTFRHFLAGYLDSAKTSVRDLWYSEIPDDWTDGVTKDRVVFVIPSSCKDVIIPMFWASAIGCKVTDHTFKIGFCEDKVTRVEVSDPYSLSNLLSLWNNQDVGLARFSCVELPKTFRLYAESMVQSVEHVHANTVVYDIEVEDVHEFVAGGIVTHNTGRLSCGGDKKNSFFTQNNVQCLEEDTSVITSEGIKPIKQVKTGDLVWTGSEFAPCQQLGSKTCSVLKIYTDCGEVVCSAEHLVLSSDSRHGIGEFRHAGDLKVGQFMKHVGKVLSSDDVQSKFSYGNVYNPKGGVPRKEIHVDKILYDFWFSLGFFLGDGNFLRDKSGGYRGIAISVGHQDIDNIPRIQAGFKEVGIDTCIRTLKKKECFDVTSVYTKSQNLTDLFLDLDFGTNAFTKKVPSVVFRLGNKQRSLFLRGLFSSDGCCNTGVSYTSVSYTLVCEVRELLWTFGISSRISQRKDTEAYTLYVHDKEKFFEYVGFEGERRKSNVRNKSEFRLDDDGYSPARIERIESVGEVVCYDLFVPKFERFVANGFIVHNSTPKPHSLMVKGRKATQEEINQGKDILGWYLSNDIPDDEAVGLVEGMDPDHFNLRRAFLPKDDDCYVVSIDMKAEELRLVANIYNEKTWADAFIHGKDVHKACYSPDTEFLVLDRGWMTADRITKGMKIAYYDPMDDEVRFTKAGERYSHEASEVYMHPTLFNVTDNHRMWIGTPDAGFRIVRASELKSQGNPKQKFRMKTAVGQRKSFQSIESHFGRKLGQYFCYGFMYFAPHYYDEEGFVHITLDSPCTKIPHDFALFLHSGDYSSTEFSVDRELSLGFRSLEAFNPCTYLFSLAKTEYKDEPIFLQDFVYGMLVYLSSTKFNTLNLGDGSKVSGKVVVSSKEHADAIQWLLMLTGSTCRVDSSKSSVYGEGAYVLTIFSDVSSLPKSLGSTFGSVKQKNLAEKHLTYSCFSVPSGLLVTRYKGQITVNGNTAIKLFGEENYSKEARKKSKIASFGILYGSGAQGFNSSFPEMSLDECRQFLAKFKEALPSIEQGQAENVSYAREHGTINTGYGRQRRVRSYFQSGDKAQIAFAERTVKNSVVQGTAADVLKLIFCRLWANVFKPYPDVTFMSTIHDEVNFSMPKRLAREVIPICMECMTIRRDDWPVTLECSLSIGRDSLGDLIPFTYNKETKEFTPEWEESSEVLKKRTGHVETESSDNESLDVEESDDPYFGLPPEACEF